jgi:hypothetical protein
MADSLEQLAMVAGVAQDSERAARLFGAATAQREAEQVPLPTVERTDIEAAVAPARAALGEEAWAAAFAAGRALSLEEAAAEALGEEAWAAFAAGRALSLEEAIAEALGEDGPLREG